MSIKGLLARAFTRQQHCLSKGWMSECSQGRWSIPFIVHKTVDESTWNRYCKGWAPPPMCLPDSITQSRAFPLHISILQNDQVLVVEMRLSVFASDNYDFVSSVLPFCSESSGGIGQEVRCHTRETSEVGGQVGKGQTNSKPQSMLHYLMRTPTN